MELLCRRTCRILFGILSMIIYQAFSKKRQAACCVYVSIDGAFRDVEVTLVMCSSARLYTIRYAWTDSKADGMTDKYHMYCTAFDAKFYLHE